MPNAGMVRPVLMPPAPFAKERSAGPPVGEASPVCPRGFRVDIGRGSAEAAEPELVSTCKSAGTKLVFSWFNPPSINKCWFWLISSPYYYKPARDYVIHL